MKYIDENFLLKSDVAKELYEHVKNLPIIDYHCHLNPKEIAENKKFNNLTEIWLSGDHYKWRAMRANGVEEKYITGDAPDYEKFEKWAETMEECIGNPLHHWTHLELRRCFNYEGLLTEKTAKEVWEHCNKILQSPDFSIGHIFNQFGVEVVCTTDDPADDLAYCDKIKSDAMYTTKVLPTFRPSNALNIEGESWKGYIVNLGNIVGKGIANFEDICDCLSDRLDYFAERGCLLSDHALDPPVFEKSSDEELNYITKKALNCEALSIVEINKYKTALLIALGKEYGKRNWSMQLHIGCIRGGNSAMLKQIGPDTGYDCMDDKSIASPIVNLLDSIGEYLPKTILYCLNPKDNEALASITGIFQGGGIKGKIQFGSGWWFNDQKDGMTRQLTALASIGLLPRFIGMLTDSRSFLSYTRHEYFRRILCSIFADWLENGEVPYDMDRLKEILANISYFNAKEYFRF